MRHALQCRASGIWSTIWLSSWRACNLAILSSCSCPNLSCSLPYNKKSGLCSRHFGYSNIWKPYKTPKPSLVPLAKFAQLPLLWKTPRSLSHIPYLPHNVIALLRPLTCPRTFFCLVRSGSALLLKVQFKGKNMFSWCMPKLMCRSANGKLTQLTMTCPRQPISS